MKRFMLLLALWFLHTSLPAEGVWGAANNSITYSVFQDNIELGDHSSKTIVLSKLALSVATGQEGSGTSQDYDYVPMPTGAALLCIGIIVILLRRKRAV